MKGWQTRESLSARASTTRGTPSSRPPARSSAVTSGTCSNGRRTSDITENTNIEVGTSYATGKLEGARNSFGGIDVTYRWKPLERGLYRGLITRFEGLINDRPDLAHHAKGFYASADYQLGQRWFTGVRVDSADRITTDSLGFTGPVVSDHGVSATLTFWPSEFSQIRGQLRRTKYGDLDKPVTELLMQLQFAIGAHGAHTF